MLTATTIRNAIATSIETIRHRLQRVPISAEAIARVYGVDAATATELAAGINIFDAIVAHRDIETASVTCTFSCSTIDRAEYTVADILSGLQGMFRLKFYTPNGVLGHRSVIAHPDQIGLINSVALEDGYLFRLPKPGQEPAFAAGEPVETDLWRCDRSSVDLVDSYRERGGFEAWLSAHAEPYIARELHSHARSVLHVEFAVRCTPERLHSLATQPEVTAIVSLDGLDAFK